MKLKPRTEVQLERRSVPGASKERERERSSGCSWQAACKLLPKAEETVSVSEVPPGNL